MVATDSYRAPSASRAFRSGRSRESVPHRSRKDRAESRTEELTDCLRVWLCAYAPASSIFARLMMKPLGAGDPAAIASYRLLGVLGGGGMGRVFLAESRTGRRVAIKVIREELAEDPV